MERSGKWKDVKILEDGKMGHFEKVSVKAGIISRLQELLHTTATNDRRQRRLI